MHYFRTNGAVLNLGFHTLSDPGDFGVTFNVTKDSYLIHENYKEKPLRHDIAVIVLQKPVTINGKN